MGCPIACACTEDLFESAPVSLHFVTAARGPPLLTIGRPCGVTGSQDGIGEPAMGRVSVQSWMPNGGYLDLRSTYRELVVLKARPDGVVVR